MAGDSVKFEDLIFTVLATRGRRITQIRVQRKHEESSPLAIEGNKADIRLLPAPQDRNRRDDDDDQPPGERSGFQYRGA